MKIEVRLFATLREGRGKILELDVENGSLVSDLLQMLNIKHEDVAILLINGKDGSFDSQLSEGYTLSIFPPVGGG